MQYSALVTKEGKQTLAEFPGCPGCQTFADPGEDIAERAEEALAGWLDAHLASGQAPPEPRSSAGKGSRANHRGDGAGKVSGQASRAMGEEATGHDASGLARRAGLIQPAV